MKIQKRPFILLEVLLAVALLAMFSSSLLRIPVQTYQKDLASMQNLEYERLFAIAFADVRQYFFEKKIPWNPSQQTYLLEEDFMCLPRQQPVRVKRFFTIEKITPLEMNDAYYQKLRIRITLQSSCLEKQFCYPVLRKSFVKEVV